MRNNNSIELLITAFYQKMCLNISNKNAFTAVLFSFVFWSSVGFAQSFVQSDLDRLIKNHPLMKSFNKDTGFFENTNYDKADVNKIFKETSGMEQELDEINKKISSDSKIIFSDGSDEEKIWEDINQLNTRQEEIERKLKNNQDIIDREGYPERTNLVKIVDKITEDSILPLFDNNKIVLNKLPKYDCLPPEIQSKDLRNFYYSLESDNLKEYLRHSYNIGLLFLHSDNIVSYYNSECKSGKVALVDFSKLLSLHPKMSLFDFSKFGFYKKEICDSSKKKVYNEIIKLKDVKSFNEDEHGDLSTIEETRQILDSIETEISLTIGGYAKQNNIEVVLNMASNSKNSEYDELWDKTEKFGNLLAGNNLYFILSKKNISMPLELNTIDTPQLIYWLEIMKNPMVSDVYLTDDYPVIIYGGERIDDKIIEQIYHKYSVDSNVKEIVKLVLSKYFINWE